MAASAGSFYSDYRIGMSLLDADIAAAKRRLLDLRAFAQQTIGTTTTPGAGGTDRATAQAAIAQQRLATEQQRTAATAGQASVAQQRLSTEEQRTATAANQAAVASQRLATEQQRTAASAAQAAAAQTRAETAAFRLAQAQDRAATSAQRSATYAQQMGAAFGSSLTSILGPAAAVGVAIGALGQVDDLVKLGLQAEQTAERFDQAARAAGTTGEAYTRALRAASAGTVSDLNLQLAANRARLLGVGDSAAQLAPLLAIARDRAQEMGISTTQAFNDLVTGLGRGSALILDNLGITVSVTEANQAYATSIGKNVNALTEQEQKTALINAVLAQSAASMAATGGAIESNSVKIERLNANWDNLKARAGVALASVVGPAADGAVAVLSLNDRIQEVAATTVGGAQSFQEYGQRVTFVNGQLAQLQGFFGIGPKVQALSLAQFNYAKALQSTGVSAADANAKALALGSTFSNIGNVQAVIGRQASLSASEIDLLSNTILRLNATGGEGAAQVNSLVTAFFNGQLSAQELAAAIQQIEPALAIQAQAAANAAVAAQVHSSGMDQEIQAAIESGNAIRAATQATAEAATQAQVDAAAKSAEAAETELLAAQNQKAADTFLLLNPNISASGIAAAAAAAGYSPQIARLIELTLRANTARGALADLNALAGVKTAVSAVQRATDREFDTPADRAEVKSNQALEANRALLAKISADNARAARAGAGGGGGGGGTAASARLTDQQKLNNTLLNDQAKYQDQAEAQEREHTDKLLKIQADFEEKSLAQQRANEISKRQGRVDFYDALTSSSKDLGEKESQALSASYEQAYAKAQEIAQAGNQKLADDYLSMRQQQLQKEIEYQKARKAAADDGDKGEVARLDAIRKMQVEVDAEKEKQLLAGGDANVNARDAAINAEDQRFIDQQDKNATAAEAAGVRKRDAAIRNGAAIDVENEKLREQERILARVGGRPPGTGAGLDGAPPPPSTGAAPAGAGAPPGGGDQVWRVFDSGVVDALNAQTDRLSGDLAGVRKAVEDLGPRIRAVESAVGSIQSAVR